MGIINLFAISKNQVLSLLIFSIVFFFYFTCSIFLFLSQFTVLSMINHHKNLNCKRMPHLKQSVFLKGVCVLDFDKWNFKYISGPCGLINCDSVNVLKNNFQIGLEKFIPWEWSVASCGEGASLDQPPGDRCASPQGSLVESWSSQPDLITSASYSEWPGQSWPPCTC